MAATESPWSELYYSSSILYPWLARPPATSIVLCAVLLSTTTLTGAPEVGPGATILDFLALKDDFSFDWSPSASCLGLKAASVKFYGAGFIVLLFPLSSAAFIVRERVLGDTSVA